MKNSLKYIILVLVVCCCTSCRGCADRIDSLAIQKRDNPHRLNPCHHLEFTDCGMTYNGKPFALGQTIDQFVEVFGPYDRKAGANGKIYIWDSIGIRATTPDDGNPNQVWSFYVMFNMDMSNDSERTRHKTTLEVRRKIVSQSPKYFFGGNILVDGVPLGRDMKMKNFLKQTTQHWSNDPFPVLYRLSLQNCNQKIKYTIRVAGNGSGNIESFYTYLDKFISSNHE